MVEIFWAKSINNLEIVQFECIKITFHLLSLNSLTECVTVPSVWSYSSPAAQIIKKDLLPKVPAPLAQELLAHSSSSFAPSL